MTKNEKAEIVERFLIHVGIDKEMIGELKTEFDNDIVYIYPLDMQKKELPEKLLIAITCLSNDIPLIVFNATVPIRNNKNVPAIYKLMNTMNNDSIMHWTYEKEDECVIGKYEMLETYDVEKIEMLMDLVVGSMHVSMGVIKDII